jgi:hypothetical protein
MATVFSERTQRNISEALKLDALMNDAGLPRSDWRLMTRYVVYGQPPGDFLESILEGDLFGAVEAGNDDERQQLVAWAQFVHCFTPEQCHGSAECVRGWMAKGGTAYRYRDLLND